MANLDMTTTLKGYFSEGELAILEAAQDLPATAVMLDRMRFARVSRIVLGGLIEHISASNPIEASCISSVPHPYRADPASRMEIATGDLPDVITVNPLWIVHTSVGVPINSEQIEDEPLNNPEPTKNGICDPTGILHVALTWLPSTAALDMLDGDEPCISYDEDWYETLEYTRVGDGYEWGAITSDVSLREQTAFLLRVGSAANISPPYIETH